MTSSVRFANRSAALAIAAAFACAWAPLAAQSAEQILLTSLERHEERMEGIESYTVVQETMGFETTVTFERSEIDGHAVFVPAGQEEGGSSAMASFYELYPKIAERAELRGQETVDGEECWIVGIDDLSDLELDERMAMGDQGEFVPTELTLYIDTSDYLVRKMSMEGEITADGETRPTAAEVHLADYREVEGVLHPFTTRITATGTPPGMSEKDLEKTRKSLADMEKQLEEMDESQRAMVERMMGPQMEKLREMLESGQFELTMTTKEVRVNE